MKEVNKEFDAKMQKTIDVVMSDFASVRASRANAAVLDRITVDYYGTPTPIQQIAAISTPDPRILQISPGDNSALKSIEKARYFTKNLPKIFIFQKVFNLIT